MATLADILRDKIEYKPGDIVPISGIYTVTHDKNHHENHEVTCVKGKKFPPCAGCDHPRFKLKHAAEHIEDHSAFKK